MSEPLSLLIRAGNPLVEIETTDERYARQVVCRVATEMSLPLFEWTVTKGLSCTDTSIHVASDAEPRRSEEEVRAALNFVGRHTDAAIFLFYDLGAYGIDPWVRQKLRDLQTHCAEHGTTVVLVESDPLPPEIRRMAVRFEIELPTPEELEKLIRQTFVRIRDQSLVEVTAHVTRSTMDQIIQVLRGLNRWEVERALSAAIHYDYKLDADDIPRIVEAKRDLLATAGCLEPIAADFAPADIGGLDNLKGWLRLRRDGFTKRARDFGIESPRGVLMLGVQGCGKSLCAKVVAADWGMPLLRLDPGVLYQKFIGESESQLRQALRQAEAMAPVVLWIDEIEKAFASASAESADGGLSKRMFGTLLAWMQDHRQPIFIVATANDVSALPPELLRKGRFDEVFFVDLPNAKARKTILGIHLRRRDRDPAAFDLAALAAATEGFSGAEIEQAIKSGLYAAFRKNEPLTDAHLLTEIGKTRPLSVVARERIEALRAWAKDRCVRAD